MDNEILSIFDNFKKILFKIKWIKSLYLINMFLHQVCQSH